LKLLDIFFTTIQISSNKPTVITAFWRGAPSSLGGAPDLEAARDPQPRLD